jgi:subtilisin-like proprotein convertase family protein
MLRNACRWLVVAAIFACPLFSGVIYNSTDVPKTICDLCTVTSTLTVPGGSAITDVNVIIGSLLHTWDQDLELRLISPGAAVTVVLVLNRGASGDNFSNTTLDDSAATAIADGAAPFTGSFRPEQALSTLNGLSSGGQWTLWMNDKYSGDTGTLNSWSLDISTTTDGGVPEPGTALLAGLGLAAAALLRKMRG